MRISFVLQTYRSPGQIGRLVEALDRDCSDSLIVVAHSGPLSGLAGLACRNRIDHLLPAAPARGRFGLIDSYLCALRWLRRQPRAYDWIVLLSGQDYPIRPLPELRATLEQSVVDGYFHHFDPLTENPDRSGPMAWPRREGADRYLFRYRFLTDELTTLERALLNIPRRLLGLTRSYRLNTSFGLGVGRRADATPFSPAFRLYAGSYWHIIRRECAEAVLDFVDANPRTVEYFRQLVLPDECFIQTILLNDRAFRVSAQDLRYFDFRGSRHGHARTLGPTDLDAAFASGCFFGRKFDDVLHPQVFDLLDARLRA